MTTFTNVPKQVEELLEQWNGTTSRRNFLKGSGLLVVSVGAAAMAGANPFSAEGAAMAQAGGPLSRSRFPETRFVDRHPRGQHGHLLCREDGRGAGDRNGLPADDVR